MMASATLANQLLNLDPVATELQARQTLTDAYGVYASAAVAGAVAITVAGINLGKAAMLAALVGMNASGAGAAKLVAGVQAFWTAVAGGLATSFAGATAITPPPHAGLLALLTSSFATNTSGAASKASATSLIASNFHAQAIIGGTVTFPGPVVQPIL